MFREKRVLIFSTAYFVAFSLQPIAFALSCERLESLEDVDVAFSGVVEKIEAVYDQDEKGAQWPRSDVTFRVTKVLKGFSDSVAVVRAHPGALVSFDVHKRYLVYAHRDEKGLLRISLCTGTREDLPQRPASDNFKVEVRTHTLQDQDTSNQPAPVLIQPAVPQDQNKTQYIHATSEPVKQPVNEESKLTSK